MMAALAPMIPGAQDWPRFTRNVSEKYEARLSMVEIPDSPSLFLRAMAGTRVPVALAPGEGFADFSRQGDAPRVVGSRNFVDKKDRRPELYPHKLKGDATRLNDLTKAHPHLPPSL